MTNTNQLFHASDQKIKRAQRKFDNLEAAVNRYLQFTPYKVRMDRHADRSYIIARLVKDPPDDFAWEVVETVGHLRSALDKLIVNLVQASGRGTSGVGFPFGGLDNGKPQPFPDGRIEKGVKQKLSPADWKIIEAQRPYPGGNNTLWAINEIANEDKHRKDLVTLKPSLSHGFRMGNAGPGFGFNDYLCFNPTDCDFVLADKERETVLLALGHGSINIKIEHSVTANVVFGNVMPVQSKNVLVTLSQQIGLVKDIIDKFRALRR